MAKQTIRGLYTDYLNGRVAWEDLKQAIDHAADEYERARPGPVRSEQAVTRGSPPQPPASRAT